MAVIGIAEVTATRTCEESGGTHSLAHHCLGILVGWDWGTEEKEREYNDVGRQKAHPFSIKGIPPTCFSPIYTLRFSLSSWLPPSTWTCLSSTLALTHHIFCHSPCISTRARPWVRFQMPKQQWL